MKMNIPTMLYVEDDENDRMLLKIAQQSAKVLMNLVMAEDGEQAVAYLKGEGMYSDRGRSPAPSLVLLDLKLPRKCGFEVLEWIRGQEAFKQLPVVVLSSSSQECDQSRALRNGANSYFVKPISLPPLVEIVKRIYSEWLAGSTASARPFPMPERPDQSLLTAAC